MLRRFAVRFFEEADSLPSVETETGRDKLGVADAPLIVMSVPLPGKPREHPADLYWLPLAAPAPGRDAGWAPRRAVFSVKQETGIFKVTVVEMPDQETGENALVVKDAAKTAAEGGTVKFDIPHRVRRPPTWHRWRKRGLFLRRAVLQQEPALPDRGESVCCRRSGGGRCHALPTVARFYLA
jgi:hypothetical protein